MPLLASCLSEAGSDCVPLATMPPWGRDLLRASTLCPRWWNRAAAAEWAWDLVTRRRMDTRPRVSLPGSPAMRVVLVCSAVRGQSMRVACPPLCSLHTPVGVSSLQLDPSGHLRELLQASLPEPAEPPASSQCGRARRAHLSRLFSVLTSRLRPSLASVASSSSRCSFRRDAFARVASSSASSSWRFSCFILALAFSILGVTSSKRT